MTVALTGGNGFLGWHTRGALREVGTDAHRIAVGDAFDASAATKALAGTSRVLHIAGVNRAPETEVRAGNLLFADQLAGALRRADPPPATVVYANSSQAGNDTAYGEAKERAGSVLEQVSSDIGADFVDVRLPNLFGEHGKPFYNAVTATFSHVLAQGGDPRVEVDRELILLHVQDAADLLLGSVPVSLLTDVQEQETVTGLLARLRSHASAYSAGAIPDIAARFDRNLFNTYRSYTFPAHAPVRLVRHADARGSFFEVIRSYGGSGQSSFSITLPGISRGDHFHRRKIERFAVLAGRATISLRRLFSENVVEFEVSGEAPVAVDMPTLWAHKITNTGDEPLYTSFWTNDMFDPTNPDTIAEVV